MLVAVEEHGRLAQGLPVCLNDLLAAASLLRHERGPFEHRHVLLHRSEAHGVLAGQGRYRLLVPDGTSEDISPGRVGQRTEDAVDLLFLQAIYNHMVVD